MPASGGIIPADAGSTEDDAFGCAAGEDHPRGCGEHRVRSSLSLGIPGSSQRMRGARWSQVDQWQTVRIIPADAGSTQARLQN